MGVLQMSLSAGGLVIAIVLIRAVALNKLPKKMFLVLWGVALFRLLVPVSIPLPFSVPSIMSAAISPVLPDTAVIPLFENPVFTGNTTTGIAEIPGVAGVVTDAVQAEVPNVAPATVIWLVGIFIAFIFFAVIHYRNNRRLRFATAIRDNDFLNEWLAEHRHIRRIEIMQSDRIISPLAVGIFKPRIILSKTMDMSDKQLLNYVLTHEYYHIKRYDALWKMLLVLALCVHWFNPLVWVMFVLASRDLELTCDEAVIRRFGAKTRKDYAYMLIGMVEQGSKFAPLYNGFSKNATHERIESIMKNKKLTLASVILAVALVSVLTVGVLAASAASYGTTPNGVDEVTGIEEVPNPPNPRQAEQTDTNVDSRTDVNMPMFDLNGKAVENGIDGNAFYSVPNDEAAAVNEIQETQTPKPRQDERLDTNVDTSNDVIMPFGLISVSRNDEKRFTADEWANILAKIEKGEIYWED